SFLGVIAREGGRPSNHRPCIGARSLSIWIGRGYWVPRFRACEEISFAVRRRARSLPPLGGEGRGEGGVPQGQTIVVATIPLDVRTRDTPPSSQPSLPKGEKEHAATSGKSRSFSESEFLHTLFRGA